MLIVGLVKMHAAPSLPASSVVLHLAHCCQSACCKCLWLHVHVVAIAPPSSLSDSASTVYLQVEGFGSQSGKTSKPIVIADCGQLS